MYMYVSILYIVLFVISKFKNKKTKQNSHDKNLLHMRANKTRCAVVEIQFKLKKWTKKNREKFTFWNVIRSDAAGVFLFRAKWIQKQCLDMISGRMLHRKYYVYKIVELDTLLLYIFIARRK